MAHSNNWTITCPARNNPLSYLEGTRKERTNRHFPGAFFAVKEKLER